MIILTTHGIAECEPKRMSSIIDYTAIKWCLAEINDHMEPSLKKVDFWWQLCPSGVDIENFDAETRFDGGIVESIELQLSLSKEINIAYAIYAIAREEGIDPFELWENSLQKVA